MYQQPRISTRTITSKRILGQGSIVNRFCFIFLILLYKGLITAHFYIKKTTYYASGHVGYFFGTKWYELSQNRAKLVFTDNFSTTNSIT